jgi:methenyltetrahydromethanopterin cyclohydrolase
VNTNALRIVERIIDRADELDCAVQVLENGTTIIDAGVFVDGSHEAGRLISEACMGGLGATRMTRVHLGELTLPAVVVGTNKPDIAALGSQLAGWFISVGDFSAMGSGPARALARVEKGLYSELQYTDSAKHGVLVLETRRIPTPQVTQFIADSCGIPCSGLYCIVVPTASLAGSVQMSARVVEVGIRKLHRLGLSPARIRTAYGVAAIAPVAASDDKAMGLANDCIMYGGRVYLHISSEEGDDLESLVRKAPAGSSSQYGVPFYGFLKSVGFDFRKIDPDLLSPAEITLIDVRNGLVHRAGELNPTILRESLDKAELI